MISIIVAMSKNRVIGSKNTMPWRISEDSIFFRNKTLGHPCILGRKNFESLGKDKDGNQRILEGRDNIILTRNLNYKATGCEVVNSLEDATTLAKTKTGSEEIFICGGEEIYKLALDNNLVDKIYLTYIDIEVEGDTYFPEIPAEFELTEESKRVIQINEIELRYSFQTYALIPLS